MNQDSNTKPEKHAGGRPRKGTLEFRSGSWHGRLTVTVDGESIRKWFDLKTDNRAVARRKLARLVAQQQPTTIDAITLLAAHEETYAELAERVAATRHHADAQIERSRENLWIIPEIGHLTVGAVKPSHIVGIYDNAQSQGKSRSHVHHLRTVLRSRFAVAMFDEIIDKSPVDRAPFPKMKEDSRERAVLNDEELFIYLSWQHPAKHRRLAVLQRQTMSVLSRVFGGLRTGDMHAMQWNHFDVPEFTMGTALRSKTRKKQQMVVPEPLRPVLKAWWEETGKDEKGDPKTGPIFPTLRGKEAGKGSKHGVSHAGAMRRDLKRAFGLETWNEETNQFEPTKNREMTDRERELLVETDLTLPVDFHSWRRAFVQALADMGMSAQQAQKLAGHADLGAHERYLRTSRKTLTIPAEAFPDFASIVLPRELPKLGTPNAQSSYFSVRHERFEPSTFGSGGQRSIQLS